MILAVIVLVIILVIALLFLPLRLYFDYKGEEINIEIKIGPITIPYYESRGLEKRLKEITEIENKSSEERVQVFFALLQAFYETSDIIRKAYSVEKLKIKSDVGFEDAAVTGIVIGIAYAEIYKLISFLESIFSFNPPEITITPVFEDKHVFSAEAEGIIKSSLVHIIYAESKFRINYENIIRERID